MKLFTYWQRTIFNEDIPIDALEFFGSEPEVIEELVEQLELLIGNCKI